ncbi:MAG: hypothetical protein GXZ13_07205 [Synergistaceae bacterium]|nr:hypothetical protein [Synergistaceae bacterium]
MNGFASLTPKSSQTIANFFTFISDYLSCASIITRKTAFTDGTLMGFFTLN